MVIDLRNAIAIQGLGPDINIRGKRANAGVLSLYFERQIYVLRDPMPIGGRGRNGHEGEDHTMLFSNMMRL